MVRLQDDHAYQAISAYSGYMTQTPNIDRIAQEGMLFTNAFVTNSICAPSGATLAGSTILGPSAYAYSVYHKSTRNRDRLVWFKYSPGSSSFHNIFSKESTIAGFLICLY